MLRQQQRSPLASDVNFRCGGNLDFSRNRETRTHLERREFWHRFTPLAQRNSIYDVGEQPSAPRIESLAMISEDDYSKDICFLNLGTLGYYIWIFSQVQLIMLTIYDVGEQPSAPRIEIIENYSKAMFS